MEIKYYRALKNVDRLSGVSKHRSYNILEHSYMVAILFKYFASKENVPYGFAEFDYILNHDLLESVSGDLSYEVKNISQLTKDSWHTIEKEVIHLHPSLSKYSDSNIKQNLSELQFKLFKACDLLDLWIFLIEERALGNYTRRVQEIIYRCEELIDGLGFKKINEFIKNYKA